MPRAPPRLSLPTLIRTGSALRPKARDLSIVFPHSFRAALLAYLTRSERRVGYARNGRTFLLTDAVEPHRENGKISPIYMGDEYLNLLEPIGCTNDAKGLELRADDDLVHALQKRLPKGRPLIGLAPGAAFGPSKQWPAERYAAVADALTDSIGAQCVLLTGPGEEKTRLAVEKAARNPLLRYDDGNPTVALLKATVSHLDLLICNDSGPRHIAVAFNVPTIVLMGPTSPRYSNGPYEKGEVLRVEVDCGPCQKPICSTDHRCMTRITPQEVVKKALTHLEDRHTAIEK